MRHVKNGVQLSVNIFDNAFMLWNWGLGISLRQGYDGCEANVSVDPQLEFRRKKTRTIGAERDGTFEIFAAVKILEWRNVDYVCDS